MADANDELRIQIGPFNDPAQLVSTIDFVVHYQDDTWDNNGGSDYHIPVTLVQPTSVAESTDDLMVLYPNPTSGKVMIQTSGTLSHSSLAVEVLDISGRKVYASEIYSGEILDIGDLAGGAYMLRLLDRKGIILETEKVILK